MTSRDERIRARRRVIRRRRQVAVGGLVLCGTLIAMGFSGLLRPPATAPAQVVAAGSSLPASAISPAAAGSTPTTPASPSSPPEASVPPSSPQPSASPPLAVRATGVFERVLGGTARRGTGTLKTYAVEVETGTRQSAPDFGAAVDATLSAPASWTGQGRWSFQRRATDNVDFIIRLATPATVDTVCAKSGLDTRGYVSCRSGRYVMINLNRWLHAVPDYRGDVARYRLYVINHEVGHQLGYSHQACPGPGRVAPVMQQQTFGLKGCVANGWPYVGGKLILGLPAA